MNNVEHKHKTIEEHFQCGECLVTIIQKAAELANADQRALTERAEPVALPEQKQKCEYCKDKNYCFNPACDVIKEPSETETLQNDTNSLDKAFEDGIKEAYQKGRNDERETWEIIGSETEHDERIRAEFKKTLLEKLPWPKAHENHVKDEIYCCLDCYDGKQREEVLSEIKSLLS